MSELHIDGLTYEQVAKTIDHALLRPELTDADVHIGCELAAAYGVATVCVRPSDVPLAVSFLPNADVGVSTVIGFPHGSTDTGTKVFEAQCALGHGAVELDMVIHIGRLRGGEYDLVREEIRRVVEAAADQAIVKVIMENAYLTDEEKVRGCELAEEAGAGYVKTSTGFAPTGATLEDVRLMRRSVSPRLGVKAAGGIRTLDSLLAMLAAGATRIGASATDAILDDFRNRSAERA